MQDSDSECVVCAVNSTADEIAFTLQDDTRILTSLAVARRSAILRDALEAAEGSGTHHGNEMFHLIAPAGFLLCWLEVAGGPKLHTVPIADCADLLQAADFFADEDAVDKLCQFLAGHCSPAFLGTAHETTAHQVLRDVPEHLAIRVLRTSSEDLNYHIRHLPDHLHPAAVHAALPSLLSHSHLELDCAQVSHSAASAAVQAFASLPERNRLTLRQAPLCMASPSAPMLDAIHRAIALCPATVSISSSEIHHTVFQNVLDALEQNSRLVACKFALGCRHVHHQGLLQDPKPAFVDKTLSMFAHAASGLRALTIDTCRLQLTRVHEDKLRFGAALQHMSQLTRIVVAGQAVFPGDLRSLLANATELAHVDIEVCTDRDTRDLHLADNSADPSSAPVVAAGASVAMEPLSALPSLSHLTTFIVAHEGVQQKPESVLEVGGKLGTSVLAPVVHCASGLKRLDLGECLLSGACRHALCSALAAAARLESLSLRVCSVRADAALLAAAAGLPKCTAIALHRATGSQAAHTPFPWDDDPFLPSSPTSEERADVGIDVEKGLEQQGRAGLAGLLLEHLPQMQSLRKLVLVRLPQTASFLTKAPQLAHVAIRRRRSRADKRAAQCKSIAVCDAGPQPPPLPDMQANEYVHAGLEDSDSDASSLVEAGSSFTVTGELSDGRSDDSVCLDSSAGDETSLCESLGQEQGGAWPGDFTLPKGLSASQEDLLAALLQSELLQDTPGSSSSSQEVTFVPHAPEPALHSHMPSLDLEAASSRGLVDCSSTSQSGQVTGLLPDWFI